MMAKYKSHYSNLGFYVGDELKMFSSGTYMTDDKAEIGVLDKLVDAVKEAEETPKKAKASGK